MSDQFGFDVFLSHSSKDRPTVRAIAERLKRDAIRVWFDAWEIKPGDSIPAKIEEGLERSRVLVLCMSAHAFSSDWPALEAGTFRFRDPINKERRFVPLRLDESPVRSSLEQFLFIDWLPGNREQEYPKLLEACRRPAAPKPAQRDAVPEEGPEESVRLDTRVKMWAYAFSPDGRRLLTGSKDGTVRLWDLATGCCVRVLEGHARFVAGVAWSLDQRRALSASGDGTVRLWDVETGSCLRVLKGHVGSVLSVTWSADQRRALSGGDDTTVTMWDLDTGGCVREFGGHGGGILSVAWSRNERCAASGSRDKTVRLWDVDTGRCFRVLEGHTMAVSSVTWSPDGGRVLSASEDGTMRTWDAGTGRCLHVLEGHTERISSVVWSNDQRFAVSGSRDRAVRLWDMEAGRCLRVFKSHTSFVYGVGLSDDGTRALSGDARGKVRVWNLSACIAEMLAGKPFPVGQSLLPDQVEYTNAKVLLVGESGVGKTGLAERLARDTFTPSYSTSGTWSTQWQMRDLPSEQGWERDIWLWDFGGQADQRLIHQLYVDKTALVLLVFGADRDSVLPGLREWQQALSRSLPEKARTYLVAGRTDVGCRFDRERVRAFARQHGYLYFETSALDGRDCAALRRAIQTGIPWAELERRTSPATWRLLNNEILRLRDEGHVLVTFKELRETLRQRLPSEARFSDTDLETVVGLLDGPGVVKELGFGTYILLRPEWINTYAQAVIRTLRSEEKSLGCLPVQSIAAGKLAFQTRQAGGETAEEKRLGPREEPIVLQAMEQMLLERKLCLRQEGNLVFPSYCGLEKPVGPIPAAYFISYVFGGFLDDLYATLVVKLAYCGAFRLTELWRDAADFETLADRRSVGIKLVRNDDGLGTLLVHFGRGVLPQEQVIFASYVHDHLVEKATKAQRLRFYVCATCGTPVRDSQEAMRRLEEYGKTASIVCVHCERRVPLWDALEECFASDEAKRQVMLLQQRERSTLDARRKGKLLALEVAARITSANQKCFEIPAADDEGIDMELEFTDEEGKGTGQRLYLQLKAGNSHLRRRKSDGVEIFRIRKQSWVEYWLKQPYPVMLVVGTFAKADEVSADAERLRFADVRWMELSTVLEREAANGSERVNEIEFRGERLDLSSVCRWRDKALGQGLRLGPAAVSGQPNTTRLAT